ncbi:MAG: potassium-transporting ATPase subunit KdpC [Pseudomonas sp.]
MSMTPITAEPLPLRDSGAWRASLALAPVVLLGFGLLYSLAATGITGALFPAQATGSLVERDGRVVGSTLVAQPFADARYFQPRPSAAKYDPMAAAGSNQARSNPELVQRIADTRKAVAARDGVAEDAVAGDLVTQSGSGLDPHVSVAAARQQVARVARARGLPEARVRALLDAQVEPRQFGVLGQSRVNVLRLNLALDAAK